MTLLPCTSPYSFGLVVSSTLSGGDLINGVYSENSTASFTVSDSPADVFITVVQQEFGVTLAVSVAMIWYCCTLVVRVIIVTVGFIVEYIQLL